MVTGSSGPTPVGVVNPSEAWDRLRGDPTAVLVDVRTQAEWDYVGAPDLAGLNRALVCVEWARYPGMSRNPRFVAALKEALGGDFPPKLYFICRSGARSLYAATAVADELASLGQAVACFNVAEGFEGDLDPSGHRGNLNGWKARGLAWSQS